MTKIYFTMDELIFMCHALISLESIAGKIEKEEFYKTLFDQIPINWDDSRDGRVLELSEEHWDELQHYVEKGMRDWFRITESQIDPHVDAFNKIRTRNDDRGPVTHVKDYEGEIINSRAAMEIQCPYCCEIYIKDQAIQLTEGISLICQCGRIVDVYSLIGGTNG